MNPKPSPKSKGQWTLTPNQMPNDQAAEAIRVYQDSFAAREALANNPHLTPAEKHAYRMEILKGEDAARSLVESMLRLSNRIIREIAETRYGKEGAASRIPDLESEASAIVLKAARNFDPSRKVGFSQWAAQQVRNNIRSLVMEEHDSGLKIYASWARIRRRAIPERQELALELGREPTIAELQERLVKVGLEWAYDHMKPEEAALPEDEKYKVAIAKLRKQGTLSAIENLEDVLAAGAPLVRLDKPFGDEDTGGGWAAILDDGGSHVETIEQVETGELHDSLMKALGSLDEREREVLLHRYGFVGDKAWTYKDIGKKLHISAERVRQIEDKARSKLRAGDNVATAKLLSHLQPSD